MHMFLGFRLTFLKRVSFYPMRTDQVVEIKEDISILIKNDNFLFDEQVIQDERILDLEQENDVIDTRLLIIWYFIRSINFSFVF